MSRLRRLNLFQRRRSSETTSKEAVKVNRFLECALRLRDIAEAGKVNGSQTAVIGALEDVVTAQMLAMLVLLRRRVKVIQPSRGIASLRGYGRAMGLVLPEHIVYLGNTTPYAEGLMQIRLERGVEVSVGSFIVLDRCDKVGSIGPNTRVGILICVVQEAAGAGVVGALHEDRFKVIRETDR